jgi:hypothetical protein
MVGAKWAVVRPAKRVGYENISGFRSVVVRGLGQFGLMAQDSLRQRFESVEQGPQLSILVRRGAERGHHVAREFHIDRFALRLIRPLEVRSVAFRGVVAASALRLATLHHPLEKRPFAKVLQLLKFPF